MVDPALVAVLERIATALEAIAQRDVAPENEAEVDTRPKIGRPILTPKAADAVARAVRRRRVG
jgi:hypothetical protein